jgi:hypothetical protein
MRGSRCATGAWFALYLFAGCASSVPTAAFPVARASVLENGSFEQPRLAHGSWVVCEEMTGWATTFGPGIELQNNDDLDRPAYEGRQYVELDSHAASGMRQTIALVPGAVYELRFAYAARPGTGIEDNAIEVRFDGRLLDTLHGSGEGRSRNEWSLRRYRVQSAGERAVLEFRYVGASNSLGGYLDDIALEPTG